MMPLPAAQLDGFTIYALTLKDRHEWSAAISEKGRFLLV